jgi:ribosomal protein S18 acetylase RimI-like enzyme
MSNQSFAVESDPAPHDLQYLEEQINQHNINVTGFADYQPLAVFVRDGVNRLIGGISGYTWCGFCEIAFLWVHPDYRKMGYGRKLLQTAEAEASKRACQLVVLSSYSFQAPEFYQKLGYTINGIDEGCPPGHRRYHLQKRLR